jgi:hypothetical protein
MFIHFGQIDIIFLNNGKHGGNNTQEVKILRLYEVIDSFTKYL